MAFAPNVLPYDQQLQEQRNWCWAAVAASVTAYYDSASGWRQCTFADVILGQTTCCQGGGTAVCNRPNSLTTALTETDHLATVYSPADFSNLEAEIDAGRPFCVRIAWKGGGHHVVSVDGTLSPSGTPDLRVRVRDPASPAATWMTLDELRSNYLLSGSATHVYETRS